MTDFNAVRGFKANFSSADPNEYAGFHLTFSVDVWSGSPTRPVPTPQEIAEALTDLAAAKGWTAHPFTGTPMDEQMYPVPAPEQP